jgi:DsbC/DsbD-like thiol-disulfide interchange protein
MIRIRSLIPAGVALAIAPFASLSTQAQSVPSPRDVVSATAYPSYDPVARGHEMQLAVVVKIKEGFHMNSRKPTLDYLIPTDLKIEAPTGFQPGEVSYPEGQNRTFSFSKNQPLNVYEGTITLRLPLKVAASAPTGKQEIPLKLHYQACNQEVCLPPVTIKLSADVNVVNLPSAAKPAHADLFPKHS